MYLLDKTLFGLRSLDTYCLRLLGRALHDLFVGLAQLISLPATAFIIFGTKYFEVAQKVVVRIVVVVNDCSVRG